jgi:hypothetical protein
MGIQAQLGLNGKYSRILQNIRPGLCKVRDPSLAGGISVPPARQITAFSAADQARKSPNKKQLLKTYFKAPYHFEFISIFTSCE